MTSREAPVFRTARWVALLAVALALIAAASYAVLTLNRPLDGVEGEILFEAQRIRAGLELYVDPLVGAFDYGEPPSRYYVLYPPLWSGALSLVPSAPVARIVSLAAWWGSLFWVAAGARREQRVTAFAVAAFVGSFQTLMQYGATMRPDPLAVSLAGIALARAVQREGLDPPAATLFAIAAWVKPNVLGLGAGALFVSSMQEPRATARALVAPLVLSGVVAATLHFASHGAWIDHLRRSTLQGWSLERSAQWFTNRLPFLGSLLCAAVAVAWMRRDLAPARLAGSALIASIAWTALSMGKSGSHNNYWLEPTMGAVVVLARVPLPPLSARARRTVEALAYAQAIYTDVGSIRGSIEETRQWRDRLVEMHGVRALVAAAPDKIIVGSPGIEMDLDGRVVQTPFQMSHLVQNGLFPVEPWIAQLTHPRVAGLLTRDVLEEPVTAPATPSTMPPEFPPSVRDRLRKEFVLVAVPNRDVRIYAHHSLPAP